MTNSGTPRPRQADTADFGFGTQIRKSPYFGATVRWGATGFSTYHHMYIPRDFGDPEQNFWNLVNEAILCDVAVERQGWMDDARQRGKWLPACPPGLCRACAMGKTCIQMRAKREVGAPSLSARGVPKSQERGVAVLVEERGVEKGHSSKSRAIVDAILRASGGVGDISNAFGGESR